MSLILCNNGAFSQIGLNGSSFNSKATIVIEHLIKLQMSLKLSNGSSLNGKATIMIEHLIQASDFLS